MQTPVAARSRLLRTSRIGFWLPRTVTTAHVSSIARPSPASLIPAPSAGRGPQRARRLGTGLAGPPITASRRRTMTALSDAVQYDQELVDIADYVHDYQVTSPLAIDTARLVLLDSLGCGLAALSFEACTGLLGPVVPASTVPHGARLPGTPHVLDPVKAAFDLGAMVRWLDYNDCWLAAEWGHPSDNLGGILAVADWLSRTARAAGLAAQTSQVSSTPPPIAPRGVSPRVIKIREVLEMSVKAHEIQGVLALENSFNRVGLDHVVLVKVATTAVVSRLLGLDRRRTADAVSQAWVDGQPLRTYRHAPNAMSRKSWAAGDACSRAVGLALKVAAGEKGVPTVLSSPGWGFYEVAFGGKRFEFQRGYGSYVMENVLFKVSYPAEFHAQTAIEAAARIHALLASRGLSATEQIASVSCRTHSACIRIIDKQHKPLTNFADRDHCLQYMVAVMLATGRLGAADYGDESAAARSPAIDALRRRIRCHEDPAFTADYHDPDRRTIPNGLTVTLADGSVLDEVVVEAPLGHRWRRIEAKPEIMKKYERHLRGRFCVARSTEQGPEQQQQQQQQQPNGSPAPDGETRLARLMRLAAEEQSETLLNMDVDEYMDLYHLPDRSM